MMLKKFYSLTILLLLISSTSYCQTNNDASSTGKLDTALVKVPINFIREANARLIERNYLLLINKEQDSLINDYKNYVTEQKVIIGDFQNKVNVLSIDNSKLNKSLNKQRTTNKVLWGATGASVIVTILSFLIK